MEKILLKNMENPDSRDINAYEKTGGYQGLKKALSMKPEAVIEDVKKSGLRGRGGAGFPTGVKWTFASADPKFPKYLICNADEGEPGTFKDRLILDKDPHMLIEGMAISAHALKAERGYIYLRMEYPHIKDVLNTAIRQSYERGYLGDNVLGSGVKFHLSVYQGAGAYICGEETALIESLEGKRGQPRLKPPFPASVGAFSMPTVVNNVETLANVPYIIERGPDAYSKIGSPDCPGPKLFSVSGHVEKPGVYELPMGTTLREIIHTHCGGIKGGKKPKAVIPGGISTPVLTPEKMDCPMDFVSVPRFGSMLGSGAVMVFDETTCLVNVCLRATRFFVHESCGKCTPCRIGVRQMLDILERISTGKGREGDIEMLENLGGLIKATSFCPMGQAAVNPVLSTIEHFRDDYETHINQKKCEVKAQRTE